MHQRDLALAARERQRGVEVVVGDPHPGEAAPDVAAGPRRGGGRGTSAVARALGRAVLHEVVGVGALAAGAISRSLPDAARREPGEMSQKSERGWRRGQPAGLAVLARAVVGAVQVDGELAGLARQPVLEGRRGWSRPVGRRIVGPGKSPP